MDLATEMLLFNATLLGGASSPPQVVGGAIVGQPGTSGTMYDGFTLSWGDDFDALNLVGPQNPKGKFFPTKAYGGGPRGNLTSFATSMDTDPLSTGYNDSNRGVPVGFDNISIIEPSVMRLTARKATVAEQAFMMPTDPSINGGVRNEISAMFHTAGAVGFYPTTNAVIVEVRCRLSGPAPLPGGAHLTPLWTYTLAPTAGGTGDEWDYEGSVSGLTFRYNTHVNGTVIDANFTGTLNHYDNTFRTISMVFRNGGNTEIYVNGIFNARFVGKDSNTQNLPSLAIMTAHVLATGAGADTYSKAAWDASPGIHIDYDWVRVWRTTGVSHWRPQASVPDLNLAYNASGSVVLPSKAALWGDASVVEYVQIVPYDIAEPGVTSTAVFSQFPSYITYDSGTRTLTADFTAGTGNAGRCHAVVYGYKADGSTMEPLRFSINRGPNITMGDLSGTVGVAFSYDLHAACDVGILNRKTVVATGLGSGLSYDPVIYDPVTGARSGTGLITGNPSGAAALSVGVTCTNSVGQVATKTNTINLAAVNVTVAYLDHSELNVAASSFTTASISIGPADSTRKIVFTAQARVAVGTVPTATAVFNGAGTITATKIAEVRNTSANHDLLTIFEALVPADPSGTITVTYNQSMLRCGITAFKVLNASAATPSGAAVATDNLANGSGVTGNVTLTVPGNGVAILAGSIVSSAAVTAAPTNYTNDLAATLVGGTMYHTAGHDSSGTTGSRAYSLKFNGTSAPANMVFAGVAYGP